MPIIGTLAGASARGFGGMRTFGGAWNTSINYLVVAGGGSSGYGNAGGGGAGGLRTTTSVSGLSGGGGSLESPLSLSLDTAYTVTVGAGGARQTTAGNRGNNGSNSVFSTITATGGGGSGSYLDNQKSGNTGGSGGGGGSYPPTAGAETGGAGTANQGYAGGNANSASFDFAGAGGGGAGGAGTNVNSKTIGVAGGNGVAVSISGSSVTYAGGGGGGADSTGGTGGTGGGGTGGTTSVDGTNGTVNTGGGAGGQRVGTGSAALGGSGIVIARYSGSQAAYGGTVTSSGGNTIHTFNSSSIFYTGLTLPVSGASLWLDASDSANVTLSGSNVTTWSDKSGNSNHFTAPSGKEPLYVTNLQNGLPGIKFFPSSAIKYLTNTSLGNWSASVFTAFFVFNSTNTAANYPALLSRNTIGGFVMGGDNGGPSGLAISKIGNATQSTSLAYTGTTADVGVYKATAASTTSVTVQAYKNGTAASATVTQGSLTSTGDKNSIGASVDGAGDSMAPNAYLCEIILYPSTLSDTDRNKVEGYLKAKWGTP